LDALTNYISALNFPNTDDPLYKKFWPANIHIIGKDILRFHSVYWPAFLMAAKIPLPLKVFGHGWILSDEKKMSKSLGNILDPLEIIDKYGIDQLRYYLLKEVSLGNDGNVSMKNLKNCINNDLANNFGNLCQRVFSFIEKNCEGKLPKPSNLAVEDINLINNLVKKVPRLD
jgi:methionyl-tRNA synthetase